MSSKKRVSVRLFQEHKTFFATVALIVLISLLVGVNSLETPTGYVTIQPLRYLVAGSQVDLEIRGIVGVKSATIHVNKDVHEAIITFEQLVTLPPFDGIIYSLFQGKVNKDDVTASIDRIDFTLKILEQDLVQKGLAKEDVSLYVNNQKQLTTFLNKEGDYLFFEVSAPSLGVYVIGKANKVADEAPPALVTLPSTQKEQVSPKESVEEEQEQPLVGRAEEVPQPQTPSLWEKIKRFFNGLFGVK